MEEFLESVQRAMGEGNPHIISATLDPATWRTAGKPHTWQRVERSQDGSIDVWYDSAYGCIAVQYEEDGHACFAFNHGIIVTPAFAVINRSLHSEAPSWLWRPAA